MAKVPPVGLRFLVVPNGVTAAGALRLSLSVTPDPRPTDPKTAVDFKAWPSAVAAAVRNLEVLVGSIQGAVTPKDTRTVAGAHVAAVVQATTPEITAGADALWQSIFGNGSDTTLDDSLNALLLSFDGAAPPDPGSDVSSARLGGFQTAELAAVVDNLTKAAAAATLNGQLARAQGAAGAPPAGFDGAEPDQAWWIQQYAIWLGYPHLAGDPRIERLAPKLLAMPGPELAQRVLRDQMAQGVAYCSPREAALATTPRRLGRSKALFSQPAFGLGHNRRPRTAPSGSALERLQADHRALAEEVYRFALSLQPHELTDDCAAADYVDTGAAHRKFAAILGYPTLAKALGLIVEIEIPRSALAGTTTLRGGVSVRQRSAAPLPQGEDAVWTAFTLDGANFWPTPRAKSVGQPETAPWLRENGLADLTVWTSGHPRFALVYDDVVSVLDECLRRGAQVAKARLESHPDQSAAIPVRQARGVALVDSDREGFETARKRRHDEIAQIHVDNTGKPPAAQQPPVRDLEDLLEGLRIDVLMMPADATDQTAPDHRRWRSLTARDVGIAGMPIDRTDKLALQARRARDDGMVRSMSRLTKDAIGPCLEHHDTLFTWHGDSLGVAGLPEPVPGCTPDATQWGKHTQVKAADDLAIDIDFDLPEPGPGHDRRPPLLRVGRAYYFAARLALTNGAGPTLDEAAARYGVGAPCYLGRAAGAPWTYRRCQEVRAPELLLAWNDARTIAADPEVPGEQIDTLIVRQPITSGAVKPDTTRRFLTAAGVPFDVAEQHGVFDKATPPQDQPLGALGPDQVLHAYLNPNTGEFPIAREGRVEFDPEPGCPPALPKDGGAVISSYPATVPSAPPVQLKASRGAVLYLDDSKGVGKTYMPLHPDPLGRRLRARLLDGGDARDFGTLAAPIDFWAPGASPASALPVNLQLVAAPAGKLKPGLRGTLRRGDALEVTPASSTRKVPVPTLEVILAPGESADLEIWSDVEPERLAAEHEIASGALKAAAPALLKPTPVAALGKVEALAPIGLVQNKRTVRVVHAVPKPLEAPSLQSAGRSLAFHAVSRTVDAEADPVSLRQTGGTRPSNTWKAFADRNKGLDPLKWPSEEGGATTFFVGAVRAHRRTTGKLRCEALWREHARDAYKLTAKGWRYQPQDSYARLFGFDLEPSGPTFKTDDVDLIWTDKTSGGVRALSHTFADGKARQLSLRLVATSRFTQHYPPVSGDVEAFELGTAPLPTRSAEIWTTCTFRPPPPEIERVLPIFRWRKTVTDERRVTYVRETALRIYLKRDWFASGDGEMLGLVLPIWDRKPPQEKPEACEFDTLGRFGQFLTRWGADPIHNSSLNDGVLQASDILNADTKTTFMLRLAEPDLGDSQADTGPAARKVQVLGFNPKMPDADDYSEGHYVDIVFRSDKRRGGSDPGYFPFVQLGLVRLQPHAVEGLELSHPVARFAQLAPKRSIEVKFTSQVDFTVTVNGVGFHDQGGLGTPGPESAPRTATPLLNLRVLQGVDAESVPRRPEDDTIKWRAVPEVGPHRELQHRPPKKIGSDFTLTWTETLQLPVDRTNPANRYVLVVDEIEWLPDHAGVLQERGPLLSRTIDLQPWKKSNTDEAAFEADPKP